MKLLYTEMDQKKEWPVPARPFTIGRNKTCELSIRDLSISKQHCECELQGGKLNIRDMGSRNGTWVNGQRIGEQFVAVASADHLIVGKLEMKLQDESAALAPVTSGGEEIEATMHDPEFGSSAAWTRQPEQEKGLDTKKWDQGMEVAEEVSSGDYANLLRGEVSEPGLPPTRLKLNPGVHLVGGDPTCAVRLGANGVSGRHAKFEFSGGQWFVEDLGSKNGTFVNKSQTQRAVIKPGDLVFIGPVKIEIAKAIASGEAAVPAAALAGAAAPGKRGLKPMHKVAIVIAAVMIGLVAVAKLAKKSEDDGKGGGGETSEAKRGEAYLTNIKTAVEKLKANEFQDALTHLGQANEIRPTQMVRTLIEAANHLADKPTDKIEQLIEVGDRLAKFKNAEVKEFGQNLAAKWKGERENATHRAKGDEAYNREDWLTAYNEWRKITQRDSPFREAVVKQLDLVKDKIAEKFIKDGDDAFAKGDADVAKQKYNAAIPFGSASLQSKILNKIQQVEKNLEFARFLAQAKEAFNTRNYEACIEALDKITAESDYFKEASALRERAQSILFEDRAKKLYRDGKAEEALSMLRTAVSANLTTLREKIQAVFELYSKAKDLYDRQQYEEANNIWVTLTKMEQDPENWYRIQAAALQKTDPKKLAETKLKHAESQHAAGNKLEAAKFVFEALKFDPGNEKALALRAKMEREVVLSYNLLRQKWADDKKIDNAGFLKEAKPLHDYLSAANPIHPAIKKMKEDMDKAGGGK